MLIWTKNLLIFRRRPFFFGLHLFLVRKRVPPRNPNPGATILSNASANIIIFLKAYSSFVNMRQLRMLLFFVFFLVKKKILRTQINELGVIIRGGVLEDVLGLEDVLEDTF